MYVSLVNRNHYQALGPAAPEPIRAAALTGEALNVALDVVEDESEVVDGDDDNDS